MKEGLASILSEGWPFIVVKVEAPPHEIERALRRFYGRRVRLAKLIEVLNRVDRNGGARVSTSFSPIHWWDPESYGEYAWPSKTLLEQLGDIEVEVVPWGPRTQQRLWAYAGLGIASYSEKLRGGAIEASAEPVAMVLTVPRLARNTAVIIEEPSGLVVFAAQPRAHSVLSGMGFKRISRIRFELPVRNYSERRSVAQRLRDALSKLGLFVYTVPLEEVPRAPELRTAILS